MIARRRRALPALLSCLLLAACSDGEDAASPEGPGAAGSDDPGGAGGESTDNEVSGADEVVIVDPADRSVRPSAGCDTGNATPPQGGQTLLLSDGSEGRYLATRPFDYDPSVPEPLAFVFHGANNSEVMCRGGGNCLGVSQALESQAVVIYVKSFGTSWTDAERDHNVAYFDELLAHAKQTYCVDERRVFALGTSSGAHFSNILGCRRPNDLLAIVPGAGERLEKTGCQPGRFAALVIHGVDDPHVPFEFGEEARDHYAAQNGCSTETVPAIEEMHATVRAARDADEASFGCVDYQGCDEGLPVRWCEHSEGGYDDSTHGWPAVGGELTWDFVGAL